MDSGPIRVEIELGDCETGGNVDDAAVLKYPFVTNGLGAPKGLSVWEQIVWSEALSHPYERTEARVSDEIIAALKFEAEHTSEELDDFRESRLGFWEGVAEGLKGAQRQWAAGG